MNGYVYNGISLSNKKSEILPFAAKWMDLESTVLSEISQRKKNTVCYQLYVGSKKIKQTNAYNTTKTDVKIQKPTQWLPVGREKGSGEKQGYGIKRYKLLCIKQTRTKDILYNTGNCSHCFVVTVNGV